jgi:hypothetical protein
MAIAKPYKDQRGKKTYTNARHDPQEEKKKGKKTRKVYIDPFHSTWERKDTEERTISIPIPLNKKKKTPPS